MPVSQAPNFGRSHSITASFEIPADGTQGVIIANGGRAGGFVMYVQDGHVVYESNFRGHHHDVLKAGVPLAKGKNEVVFEFDQAGAQPISGGLARLYQNGALVGEMHLQRFSPPTFTSETDSFNIGQSLGSPISKAFPLPFAFTGKLESVKVVLK